MKLTRLAVLLGLVLGLVGGAFVVADEALAETCVSHCDDSKHKKDDGGDDAAPGPAVSITAGTVTNSTVIDISADAGTAIGDASGGDNNVAIASGFDNEGGDVASAGNGGTATASANGGAVSVGTVNSGGNVGNAITVGNTYADGGDCKDCKPHDDGKKPVDDGKKPVCCDKPAPSGGGKTGGGDRGGVKALPSTGAGMVAGESSALVLLTVVGALGAAGYALRSRVA